MSLIGKQAPPRGAFFLRIKSFLDGLFQHSSHPWRSLTTETRLKELP
ncbi:hypothetical protein SynA1544_00583 [Synechococcus sp. A15-44]|nr:hypothetical protein SynA1544_00583 [Synechococcus sp. A15-44]